ncbi:MAG: nickel-responsive transcriptional regulator NikR, partial [Betaproteobacteria bacterium]
MDRFTISLPEELAAEFDRLIAERGYDNRSEAVRDILRAHLDRMREARELDGHCVANLSYVYNHHERELADRLLALSHAHHDLALSTLHAHLDHDHCIESVLLKGPVQQVRRFANSVVAERGVR